MFALVLPGVSALELNEGLHDYWKYDNSNVSNSIGTIPSNVIYREHAIPPPFFNSDGNNCIITKYQVHSFITLL